jgi:D-alanyl-D-alanine carboxypeptidase
MDAAARRFSRRSLAASLARAAGALAAGVTGAGAGAAARSLPSGPLAGRMAVPIVGWPAAASAAPNQALALRAPAILAKSAYLLDVESGAVLFQKFPATRRPMASTTKTMTGLLVAESGRLDEIVTASRQAAAIGETTMGLVQGEQQTLRELLYGLMLNSGNDAAVAIAEHLAGSLPAFVQQMNARAAALGLADTRFANPHGLDHAVYASPDHYSTARDLALLGTAALANHVLNRVAGTLAREVASSSGGEAHRLRHGVSALWWYPGALGVKTGWTGRAGQVRIVAAERAGQRLVAVVMDSPDHVGETRDLLDYGFALSARPEARTSVPLGVDGFATPAPALAQAWETYKRLALTGEGRVRLGAGGAATADAQAAALLQAVWFRDRAAFDAIYGWTQQALSRRQDHPANPQRDALFAARWAGGDVLDWSNSTAADQRIAAALLLASRLWNEPSYAGEAEQILDATINRAAISWDVGGVPAIGWSVPSANTFLKDLEPVTTSGATLTPAFYRMFAEATRDSAWLWALEGTYVALGRAAAPGGPLGGSAALLPAWFSVSRERGRVGPPIDPSWQSTGFDSAAAPLAWQLALAMRWHGDERARALLQPTAQLLARELVQRGRIAATYTRSGLAAGGAETTQYGALAGIALVESPAEAALRARLQAALASNDPERVLDAIDGLWLLAGGPPDFWRIWNPPPDQPTTRIDGVVPPGGDYPWRYFPETGHTVHGAALEYVLTYGGVEVFGLPRTEQFVEDGKPVQYFQRGRLELSPDGQVLGLAPLGAAAARKRALAERPEARPVAPFESDAERRYVPETGHSVSGGFRQYYERHGGALVLGYPLSEELVEDGFTVQYFERSVLEYLPGRPVRASLLGDDLLREKGWLK